MARPTKSDIEQRLLTGKSVDWTGTGKARGSLRLQMAEERRLFAFLLQSSVRSPTALAPSFIAGLSAALTAPDDPAKSVTVDSSASAGTGPWRLHAIESEGFGGLNTWGGPTFRFGLDGESLLIEGPNGSGKSSLAGALTWALLGERPRDHIATTAHATSPVFGADESTIGDWPPLACYPSKSADLNVSPRVGVRLTFKDPGGATAVVERTLNGAQVNETRDAAFNVPAILLETGLLMPARLSSLRLGEGANRLTEAVQKLTGLDDLAAIGNLAAGLCHRAREYLTYQRRELTTAQAQFDEALRHVVESLEPVNFVVPKLTAADAASAEGPMRIFSKSLNEKVSELANVVAHDLGPSLNLSAVATQGEVLAVITAAREDLAPGLDGIESWKKLQAICETLGEAASQRLTKELDEARAAAQRAIELRKQATLDPKMQLKAVAAQWCERHGGTEILECPLCEQSLTQDSSVRSQIAELRTQSHAAARTFEDNVASIVAQLDQAMPVALRKFDVEFLEWTPRAALLADLRFAFGTKDRYQRVLTGFAALVEAGLGRCPKSDLPAQLTSMEPDSLGRLNARIQVIERLISLAQWFREHSSEWRHWWEDLSRGQTSTGGERLVAHLDRLSEALAKAGPYREADGAMRRALSAAEEICEIQTELLIREAVAESLAPLKSLTALADAVAREALERLSARIGELLEQIHLSEQLKYHNAQLQKKEGVIVRAHFSPGLRIDAALVANTSWLRAILWAFIFALREEAVAQAGADVFPFFVFDDPQATFDMEHRHRWAQYVASLQARTTKAQIVLVTHDEQFLDYIKVDGISGRIAMLSAASPALGHIGLVEGAALDRKWLAAKTLNTPQAGRDYLSAARVHVESMLKLMLRGEDAKVPSWVIGECRTKIDQLNTAQGGIAPWNRSEFKRLISALSTSNPSIKHMEMAHHTSAAQLGMPEATDFEKHWRSNLSPALEHAFRLSRTHQALHGGLKALYAGDPVVSLPEGFPNVVRSLPLRVLGRAAALSDGRAADGRIDVEQYEATKHKKISLAQHAVYRLTARTLEPVARSGDLVIVKVEGEVTERSLVVALTDDGRILARRFEIADNHSDVAVLTAQSVNPCHIAQPVVAHKATLKLHKIVGVIYDSAAGGVPGNDAMEVCGCSGEAEVAAPTAGTLGLVEVIGGSAEPFALHGQHLITRGQPSTGGAALKALDGAAVIAEDSGGTQYFKRLRMPPGDRVILESLDSSGDHGPVVLASPGSTDNALERIWPVVGVLFELPGRR